MMLRIEKHRLCDNNKTREGSNKLGFAKLSFITRYWPHFHKTSPVGG